MPVIAVFISFGEKREKVRLDFMRQTPSTLNSQVLYVKVKPKQPSRETFVESSTRLSLGILASFLSDCAGLCHQIRQDICTTVDDTLIDLHHSLADLAGHIRRS